ncbi:MAG: chemotaxis protein CheW [Nitrospirae bacterium RIFCSPLOW2_12_42_9]|nr:MAG: chemotaxis protein CheW [Nitrospirae bacterium RIFCSPLOW2_12_42_9]
MTPHFSIKKPNQLIVFTLDDQRLALSISSVNRVIRVVGITPLPKGPDIVIGIINMQGNIIPVVNIRKRFCLPERDINLNDQIIITHTSKRTIGIVVNSVIGLIESAEEKIVTSEAIVPGIDYVEGVVKLEDGLLIIHDIEKFLSIEEEVAIDNAVKEIN